MSRNKEILKSTVLITSFSVLNILVNFFTQLVVAYFFGTSVERDAYFAASVLPTYISAVYAGSFGVVFLPLLIQIQVDNEDKPSLFISTIINISMLLLLIVFIVVLLFPYDIMKVLAPGFDDERLKLSSEILMVLMPTIFFQGLSNILISIFHSENKFLVPAISTLVVSLITLTFVSILSEKIGINSLAFGNLLGWAASLALLVPVFMKNHVYHFSFSLRNEGVNIYMSAIAPLLLAGVIYRSTTIFERLFASLLPVGSISYLGYANQIIIILSTLTTNGIVTTLFPLISRAWSTKDLDLFKKYYIGSLRIIFLICLPLAVSYIPFRITLTKLIFERGSFGHESTVIVGLLVSILMGTFIANSLNSITSRIYYITRHTTVGAFNGIFELVVYVCLAFLLLKQFSYLGLAFAQVISAAVSTLGAFLILDFKYNVIERKVIFDFIKILFAAAIQLAGISFAAHFLGTESIVWIGLIGLSGITIYLSVLWLFGIEEATTIKHSLARYLFNYERK